MQIISLKFALFVVIFMIAYFIVPKKWQWITVFIANIVFYCSYGPVYLPLLMFSAVVVYWVALKLEQINTLSGELLELQEDMEKRLESKRSFLNVKRALCFIGVIAVLGIWVVLKYGNFFIHNVNALISFTPLKLQLGTFNVLLPLGMSFYTFSAIGYLIDVYRGKYAAQKNWFKLFTFVSFFPHIIEGPFSRYDKLGVSILEEHKFSYDRLCSGAARILWGVTKKALIADKLGIPVNEILANYSKYSGLYIFFAIIGYCIQLYADFSGYMDIMCGISHILGIELSENFRQPYFAKSVEEFWRRWHITLGAWFKDYVFYPISMGKVGQKLGRNARKKWGARMGKLVPGYFALIFVWTATGLWHGANWTFLLWGYLNLIVILMSMQLAPTYDKVKERLHIGPENKAWDIFRVIRTFILVCFFRFFSVAPGIRAAFSMLGHGISRMKLSVLKNPLQLFVNTGKRDIFIILFIFICMFIYDLLNETGRWDKIKAKAPMPVRNIVYGCLMVLLVLFVGGDNDLTGGFMYANF